MSCCLVGDLIYRAICRTRAITPTFSPLPGWQQLRTPSSTSLQNSWLRVNHPTADELMSGRRPYLTCSHHAVDKPLSGWQQLRTASSTSLQSSWSFLQVTWLWLCCIGQSLRAKEAAEKKRAEQEKKRQEEERQRLEEVKQREEAEKRRAQAIMETTAAQAFSKQMTTLEEKIKGHVHSTLTASEEKNARLHANLMRFLERTKVDLPRRPRGGPYPDPKRRLNLDDYEREADDAERSDATPVTKRRTVMSRKGKEPVTAATTKKGAAASCSKQGVINFVLELRESLQTKQAPELKRMCKTKNIKWISKAQAVKDLAAAEARVAYDGFSPALNVVGRAAGTKRRTRLDKKERKKRETSAPTYRRGLVSLVLVNSERRYFSLAELLEETVAAGTKAVEFASSGGEVWGEVWGEKWSIIRRKFGTSTVTGKEVKLPLSRSKQLLERGGRFRLSPIVKTVSARCRGKGYLRLLLEMPRKQVELKYFDVAKLVFLYRCAREFKTKATRRTLKEKIAAVIRKKTGVNIRMKVNVGVKYSHKLRKRKIHNTVVLCYVLARIAQCSAAPPFMHNGKNILQCDVDAKQVELQQAVGRSLEAVMKRDLIQLDRGYFQDSISDSAETRLAGSEEQACKLAAMLSHLVVVPVDRNPGDLVVMCPTTYHYGLQMMFNLNIAYQQVTEKSESEVLTLVKTMFKKLELDKIGAWNPSAKLGQAYVLPKHKDLTRWRPIAPTFTEGSKTTGRRLARALNFLLERAPEARHFNLKATTLLKQNLETAVRKLSMFGEKSMALMASLDIKEMFTSLQHRAIAHVIDWLLQQWEMKSVFNLSLSRRGRVVILNQKSLRQGYVTVKFSQIRQMVSFELDNAYIMCKTMILKQIVGIPMGKHSSPSLACLLCAKHEVDFLNSLGADQRLVHGVRLVDDVTIAVACDMYDHRSVTIAKCIRQSFEKTYGEQLVLVRTGDGSNSWNFLGTRAAALPGPIKFVIRPRHKNEEVTLEEPLTFRCFKDFTSYSDKRAKAGTVIVALHRIKQHASDPATGVPATLSISIELRHTASATGSFRSALKTLTEQLVNSVNGARDVGVGRSTPANEPPPLRDGVGSAAFDEESTRAFIESRKWGGSAGSSAPALAPVFRSDRQSDAARGGTAVAPGASPRSSSEHPWLPPPQSRATQRPMIHHAHGTAHPDPSHAPADARHSASVPRFGEQVDHGVPAEEVPAPVSDSSPTLVPTTTGGGRSAPQPPPVLTGTLDPLQRICDLAVAQSATPVSPGGLLDAGVLGGRATTGRCRGTYRQQAVTSYYSDPLERAWHLQIMRFIVESGMPFNNTKLESFKRMFTMIIPSGVPGAPAPRLPSYHMLRTTLLDKLDGEVQKCVRPVLDTSRETGCTIMTDGWTNIRGQTLCNYLVGTEIRVVYVSTDVMRGKKDASALANAWLKRVKSMDVQLSDITAFVMDSAGVNVAAMEVFQKDESVKHIFWIPCVAHIMDLILEDIGGIDWVASRISQVRLVTRFFKRHGHAREVLEAHLTKTLLLPAETRFGMNVIMMERLVALRAALTDVVADDRWRETVWSTSKIRKDAAEGLAEEVARNRRGGPHVAAQRSLEGSLEAASGDFLAQGGHGSQLLSDGVSSVHPPEEGPQQEPHRGPAETLEARPPGVICSDGGEGVSEDTVQLGSADGGRSFRGGIERKGSSTTHPSIVRPSTHDVGDGHTDEPRPHLTGMRDIMCPPPSRPSAADPATHGQAAPSTLPTRSFYNGAGMDRRAGDIGQTSAYGPTDVPAGARSIGNVDGTYHDSMRAYEEQHGRPIRAKTSDVNDTRTAIARLSRARKKGTGVSIPYHRRRLHPFFRNRDETRHMPAAADVRGGRREVTEWTKQVEVRRDEATRSSSTTTAPQPLRGVRPQAPTILMTPITSRGSVRRTEMTAEVVA
ncbi:hypothetical protein CBR_g22181 [Chara braunii]|uniref:Reverse transcriptase domain-containing protein n=1 Tax=Chara braunii TaxID=69332 RepID=A0A388L2K7_CHABU|nr:hypothetical protein CBR_g22181 [Chara braunii]|eukprot:GBG76433.1 hypothetical protein CBR_g22181 [Chara braunii]